MKQGIFITVVFLALFSTSAGAAGELFGKNLLPDGSFELPKTADKFGRVFTHWLGWIYEKTGWFEVSPLASDGSSSCLMRASEYGKIRITSQKLDLPPGRYEISVDLRGLDIAPHRWKRPMDFSMGFDEKFYPLNRTGSFDWTRVSYVFELPPGQNRQPQFFLGLHTAGWLWVDNAKLIRVDQDTPLSQAPEWQDIQLPIKNLESEALTIRCPKCGFYNPENHNHCYGCGSPPIDQQSSSASPASTLLLADFEHSRKPFSVGTIDDTFASRGNRGLRIDKGWVSIEKALDFSQHDQIFFDVFNPKNVSVKLLVEIRDVASRGYWDRVNVTTMAPPGKSRVFIPTQLYVGEKSRPGRSLMRDRISFFSIGIGDNGPLYIDNLRLNKLDFEQYLFDELQSFDFGPVGSPTMPGTYPVHKGQNYLEERGYGFIKAKLWRSHNVLQPDPLLQDFVCPESGIFRIQLRNGSYRIMLKVDSPGGYWGEVPVYKNRKISLNGNQVLNQSVDFDSFIKKYFDDADTEDLPGVDPFKKYIESKFPWYEFDVEVTDGKLDIGFTGQNWAISLSSLIIYPKERTREGEKFVEWLDSRRKFIFDHSFQQNVNRQDKDTTLGEILAIYRANLGETAGPSSNPRTGNRLNPGDTLSLTTAGGEMAQLPLLIKSGEGFNRENLELKVSSLTDENGIVFPTKAITSGWFDLRIVRETGDGAVWSLKPRYFHEGKVKAIPNLARTFMLQFQIPPDQRAGIYQGRVELHLADLKISSFPFTLNVLPFNLEIIEDVAVGPWGSGINLPWYKKDERTRRWEWSQYEKSLKAIKASGSNTFSGRPHIQVSAKKGRIHLDTSSGDREMTLARSLGFHHIISSYGVPDNSLGYNFKGNSRGPDNANARKAGFSDIRSYLVELYNKIDKHGVKQNWLPVAWNIADEPHDGTIQGAINNAAAHRGLIENLQKTTFMGATSLYGKTHDEKKRTLIEHLPVAMLNLHDQNAIEVINKASNTFGYYNGANRWTLGRYMKMLTVKYGLGLRLLWHYNVIAGNPYYALDSREDDHCWYNTNEHGELIPSIAFLTEIVPGLNDYRYLTTLEKRLKSSEDNPNYKKSKKIYQTMLNLQPGIDRNEGMVRKDERKLYLYEKERKLIISAIMGLEK